ncbi:MAG: hypothetical protein MUE60_00290 [Candidatus Eisenbacteria bacterium]|jgi:hypothetical protein|nr:hypothetical protein [Candidatus Eisenbacteria bacterium]
MDGWRHGLVWAVLGGFALIADTSLGSPPDSERAGAFAADSVSAVLPLHLSTAVDKGVAFLTRSQLKHGEFRTHASTDITLRSMRYFDSSPFVTSFVVYSLSYIDDPRIEAMTALALRFLVGEMDRGGTWRYWTSLNDKRIDPDLDDTACISFLLVRHHVPVPANSEVFYRNLDARGRFRTWLRPTGSRTPNDVDCVVNANVLLYLGSNSRTKAACEYLNGVIRRGAEATSTVYYLHDTAFYYALSRARAHGVACLAASRDTVVARTRALQRDDGSLGDELATAFGICSMLNFDVSPDSVMDNSVRFLIRRQRPDGSWPATAFYVARDAGVWWGSEEMTTALCLEALARYARASRPAAGG